ncbi:NAD(P)H-dependent oxidoreductase [Brevibacillus sp. H7]|uniref:NAD(P)H-dependent oxidoreductase n=1 Tax=Brevibacillus sp. H7 TaxID=3349138 RepID=UPI003802843F
MKACIVFAHEGTSSFNHEILNRVTTACEQAGIEYKVRDLYKMNFKAVFDAEEMRNVEQKNVSADIAEEQELLTEADLLVMIYPVWWWAPPAILKGYIDRVFTNNFAFRYEANGPIGLLSGKQAVVFTTTRESDAKMREKGLDQVIQKQIADGTLSFIGYDVTYKNYAGVPYVSEAERDSMLLDVETTMAALLRQPVGV